MAIETIFFDRDGVINDVVVRDNLVSSPRTIEEFYIREDFSSFYKCLSEAIQLFVVSNQPDVARKLLPVNILEQMHNQLLARFSFKDIVYCLHDTNDQCQCRKPKPGMINDLISKYGLTKNTAIIVGDSEKDILAGQAAGIRTVFFKQPHNSIPRCNPDFVIRSLDDMLNILEVY